jgi:photosystem II stability/assembly factor-like uncharacterized protein
LPALTLPKGNLAMPLKTHNQSGLNRNLLNMLKLSLWHKVSIILMALVLSACGGAGSSASAPSAFKVTPGNGQVTITWQADPGVEYWLMYSATSAGLDIKNPPVGHVWATNVTSPYVITGLTNGVAYSFAMNGRTGGGAGGPQTASLTATPHVAGSTWTAGATAGSNDLLGLAYTTANYVAVGTGGALYKGTDGVSWTQFVPVPSIAFKAATYAFGKFIAVGAATGGSSNNVLYSTDTVTWNGAAAGSTALNALASNGTTVVAVGDGGKVFYSTDGGNWTAASGLTGLVSDLYSVAYSAAGMWVAVGQNGALLTSSDGMAWTVQAAITVPGSYKLNAVTATASGVFVVVGDHGTILTSSNGTSWAAQTSPSVANLYAVSTDSVQYLAVGAGGTVLSSVDSANWTSITQTSVTTDLMAIVGSVTQYVVVGKAGANMSSIN